MRLHAIPDGLSAAVCAFPTVTAAVDSVIEAVQCGIPIARVELLDALTVSAVNRYSKLSLPEAPTLWYEFHGTTRGVEEQATQMQAIAREHGGLNFEWATRPEDRTRLWQARHDAYFAVCAAQGSRRSQRFLVPIRGWQNASRNEEDIARSHDAHSAIRSRGGRQFFTEDLVDPNRDPDLAEAGELNTRLVRGRLHSVARAGRARIGLAA